MKRPYKVTLFYGKNAKHPKRPGDIAIEVVNATEHGAKLDKDIGIERKDIGRVIWSGPNWGGSWNEDAS